MYYSPLIILTLLGKMTQLNKVDEYYDQIEQKNILKELNKYMEKIRY